MLLLLLRLSEQGTVIKKKAVQVIPERRFLLKLSSEGEVYAVVRLEICADGKDRKCNNEHCKDEPGCGKILESKYHKGAEHYYDSAKDGNRLEAGKKLLFAAHIGDLCL